MFGVKDKVLLKKRQGLFKKNSVVLFNFLSFKR